MGLPVTVYRSTDAGAPQLNGAVGTWLNVIQKCLVDGYGAKTALGWSRDFYDASTGRVIYRNNISDGGSGGVVSFSAELNNVTSTSKSLVIQCAKDAGGIDSLSFSLPSLYRLCNTSGLAWELIGTSRGFYIIQHDTSNSNLNTSFVTSQWTIFIGDIISYFNNDDGIFTMVSGSPINSNTASTEHTYSIGGTFSTNATLYNVDGTSSKVLYSIPAWTWRYTGYLPSNNTFDPVALNATVVLTPALLTLSINTTDVNGINSYESQVSPSIRGVVSGLYSSPMGCYDTDTSYPREVSFDGSLYSRVRGDAAANLWINIESWNYA
jgi:hypothetical protein